jgi:hypothetical protein
MIQKELFFILLAGILFAGAIAVFVPLATTEQVLPVTLNVTTPSDRAISFALTYGDQNRLDFGTTFPGTTVIKTVNISRGSEPPAFVSISWNGTIKPWLEVSDNNFLLTDSRQLNVSAVIPKNADAGSYSGQLVIAYKKTLFSTVL